MKRSKSQKYVWGSLAALMVTLNSGCQTLPFFNQPESYDDFFKIVKVSNQENQTIKQQLQVFRTQGHRIKIKISAALMDVENTETYIAQNETVNALFDQWLKVKKWHYSRLIDGDTVCIDPPYVYHYEVFDKSGKSLGEIPTWWYYESREGDRSVQSDLIKLPGIPLPQQRYVKKAKAGDSHSQLLLGNDYMEIGYSVRKDPAQAIYWWNRAAKQGEPEAFTQLGNYYLQSDPARAVSYFKRGAKLRSTPSKLALARCYRQGTGVAPNATEAVAWYRRADRGGSIEAAMELGEFYRDGELGLTPDLALAQYWFRKAAALGSPESVDALEDLN